MQYTRIPQPALVKYTLAFVLCKSVSALPITGKSPKPSNKVIQDFEGPLHQTLRTFTDNLVVGVWLLIGLGIVFILRYFVMPKSIKEKRMAKDYRASPIGKLRVEGIQEGGGIEEKGKPMIDNINRVWIDSVIKEGGSGPVERNDFHTNARSLTRKHDAVPVQTSSFSFPPRIPKRHPTLAPLKLTNAARASQEPGSVLRSETHNFGENPQYHDDTFQYTSLYRISSVSNPPSPFSSRFCSTNVRKLTGHKRSLSTPTPYPTLEGLVSYPSNFVASPNFPLPTLRPITPPDTVSAPATPHPLSKQESLNTIDTVHYAMQDSQLPQSQPYQRAVSVPLLGPSTEPESKTRNQSVGISGAEDTRENARAAGSTGSTPSTTNTGFQPVMICEQGQSASGQRWKRKVTVFRSEILDRFKENGVVRC